MSDNQQNQFSNQGQSNNSQQEQSNTSQRPKKVETNPSPIKFERTVYLNNDSRDAYE